MVLGLYFLTYSPQGDLSAAEPAKLNPRPKRFASEEEVELALEAKQVDLQDTIEYRRGEELLVTTPGRVIFNEDVARAVRELLSEDDDLEVPFINRTMAKREAGEFISELVDHFGAATIAVVLDTIKRLGFKYATQAGITISKNDIVIPGNKDEILTGYEERVGEVEAQYERGLITEAERHESIVNIWTEATDTVADAMEKTLYELNPVYMMANSGARSSTSSPPTALARASPTPRCARPTRATSRDVSSTSRRT
jgi:DNA-directed RNA polymerase subunit beta'